MLHRIRSQSAMERKGCNASQENKKRISAHFLAVLDKARPARGQTGSDPGCAFFKSFANEEKDNSDRRDAKDNRRKTELPGICIEVRKDVEMGDEHGQKHLIDGKRIGVSDAVQGMIG